MQPKPLGLGRWSLLPLFRGPAKIATTCDNATLWAVGKAQFLRNKGITLECELNFFFSFLGNAKKWKINSILHQNQKQRPWLSH